MPALAVALLATWIGLAEHHPELRAAIASRVGSTLLALLQTQ